jgi:hypothetical protein
MLSTSINKNTINKLRDRLFYKSRLSFFILKELEYRNKVKETYS